jgi:hypothetical protein
MIDDAATACDDDVLALLRDTLSTVPFLTDPTDPPPISVLDGALWVHDWLNMDAELAERTFDSTDQVELAGARSRGSIRELTFVSDGRTIQLTIEPGALTVSVVGTIEPPTVGQMQLVVGGEVFAGEIDPVGDFVIDGVAHGTVLAFVDTLRAKIRLGAFEV